GREFLPTEEFKPLSQFIGSLEDLGIESLALEAGEEGRSLILPLGGRILFSRSSDLTLLYSDLKAFLNNDSIRSQTDFLEKVSELDLRTKNKIRWTFK
ncbi:MAG: hypothetical protein Q7S54_00370, partial [bacterium]|nr:hypothetical protein [bacterium]